MSSQDNCGRKMRFIIPLHHQGVLKVRLQTLRVDSTQKKKTGKKSLHTGTCSLSKANQFHGLHVCPTSILWIYVCGTTWNNWIIPMKECSIHRLFNVLFWYATNFLNGRNFLNVEAVKMSVIDFFFPNSEIKTFTLKACSRLFGLNIRQRFVKRI